MLVVPGSVTPVFLAAVIFMLLCHVMQMHGQHRSCSQHSCKPPKCRCPGHSIPGHLRPEQVPQMVLLTFDDAVNWENWNYYLRLFPPDGSRKNPNGCPISSTFFVSHNFTDYCMVRKLHARGMEIADHSVTHKLPRKWWTDADEATIAQEVLQQKSNLVNKAHIPESDIRGWRSPFLQPAGDDLFSVLYKNNFTYDATLTYSFPKNLYSPVLWPFTLDFGYTLVCNIARCPQRSFPGLWVLPVVVVMDYREQKPCAYVDHCANMPRDAQEAYQMLWKNFLRNYRSNRAPLYLNLHSPWLDTSFHLEALDQFIQKVVSMDDVYLVTVTQALEWQMNPTPLDQLNEFQAWQCPKFEPHVEDRKICSFTYKHKTAAGKFRNDHNGEQKPHDNARKVKSDEYFSSESSTKGILPSDERTDPNKHGGSDATDDEDIQIKEQVHQHHSHARHRPWFLKSNTADIKQAYSTIILISILMFISRIIP